MGSSWSVHDNNAGHDCFSVTIGGCKTSNRSAMAQDSFPATAIAPVLPRDELYLERVYSDHLE